MKKKTSILADNLCLEHSPDYSFLLFLLPLSLYLLVYHNRDKLLPVPIFLYHNLDISLSCYS